MVEPSLLMWVYGYVLVQQLLNEESLDESRWVLLVYEDEQPSMMVVLEVGS